MAAKTFTIQEIAEMIDVPARTIRKVLRANIEKDAQPGRGARWAIAEKDIKALTEKVNAFNARAVVVADLSD
jgi:hypothetical protein